MPEPKQPTYSILVLINVRWWNATAFYAVNIARTMKKYGHSVWVGCREDHPAFEKARALGLDVVPFDFSGFNPFSLIRNLLGMLFFIKQKRIQIINAHRSEDHAFAVLSKLLTGVRVVLTRGDRRTIRRGFLSSLKYKWCDGAIATCRTIIAKNHHIFSGPGDNTAVVYGSVDEDRFKPVRSAHATRRKYGLDNGRKIVGLVGRLSPVKDPYTFIRAAARIVGRGNDATFVIAGKEVEITQAGLMQEIRENEIQDHIVLLPHVDDIADLMNIFDIGVVTSTGSETISRVLLEYMYLKKPVVGTRVNAIGEIIQPGINGDLIQPGDAEGLAEKIERLLKDPRLCARYGESSFEIYRKKYSENGFYRQTLEVLRKAHSG